MKNILTAVFLFATVCAVLISCENDTRKYDTDISVDSTSETSATSYYETTSPLTENISGKKSYLAAETLISSDTITSNENAAEITDINNTVTETDKKDDFVHSTFENVTIALVSETAPITDISYLLHDDMFFTLGGTEIRIGGDVEDLIAALGKPESSEISKGYFGDRDAKIYNYADITLYTYMDNDDEKICDIEIRDSKFSTAKGLSVGMSVQDAEKIYGKGKRTGDIIFYYGSESEYMYLFISENTIFSIGYAKEI